MGAPAEGTVAQDNTDDDAVAWLLGHNKNINKIKYLCYSCQKADRDRGMPTKRRYLRVVSNPPSSAATGRAGPRRGGAVGWTGTAASLLPGS